MMLLHYYSSLFLRIWYNTTAPTNPSRPSLLKLPMIPIMLSITDTSGQKGIAAPLNSTSNTTPNAIMLTPTSVSFLAQELKVLKNSYVDF